MITNSSITSVYNTNTHGMQRQLYIYDPTKSGLWWGQTPHPYIRHSLVLAGQHLCKYVCRGVSARPSINTPGGISLLGQYFFKNFSELHDSSVPVLVEDGHDRHGVEHLPAHGPAWSIDGVLWYFQRWETLAGQCLQRSEHGATYERLAQLRLVHKWIVLRKGWKIRLYCDLLCLCYWAQEHNKHNEVQQGE